MQDFLDDLEQRLQQVAAEDAAPAHTAAARRRRRRPAVLGGLTAILAAAAAAFTMTGTSFADLPILGTDTEDASHIESQAQSAAAAGVDFSKAHVFGTPGGPGYALVNEQAETMCIAVPDPAAPGSYGQSCAPIATVEAEGLLGQIPGDTAKDPDATSLSVFVLPEDAENVQLETDGQRSTPKLESGVVVVQISSESTLRWTVDDRQASTTLIGPLQTELMSIPCPGGRRVEIEPPPSENPAFLDELRKRVCKR